MGCTASTLADWLRPGRKMYSKDAEKRTLLVLRRTASSRSYLSRHHARQVRSQSWSPQHIHAFPSAAQILDHTPTDFMGSRNSAAEESGMVAICVDTGPDHGHSQEILGNLSTSMLETPPRVCAEQERRLRCANLEVLPGRVGMDSDDDEDGFQFTKRDEHSTTCIADSLWTDMFSMAQETDTANSRDRGPAAEQYLKILPVSSKSMVETPPRVCTEQETRLRCANLEVLHARGGVDCNDAEDEFQFTNIDEGSATCVADSMWVDMISVAQENDTVNSMDRGIADEQFLQIQTVSSKSMVETPPRVCAEQERRLRCANLEVLPGRGGVDSDDEEDGFQFAKIEESPASCITDAGNSISYMRNKGDILGHFEASMDDFDTHHSSAPASMAPVEVHPFSYFHDRNYFAATSSYFSPHSEHSASSDLSPCLAMHSLADPYDDSDALHMSPECLAGSQFSANESVLDSFNESGIDEALCPTPMSEWSFQSPDVGWELSSSLQKLEHLDSFPVHAQSNCRIRSASNSFDSHYKDALIPGLPDDLAQLCLMRVYFVKYDPNLRMVCRRWKSVLSSEEFFSTREALGIHETYISFVVHGNRVHIFNLQTLKWFCLPPLPKEEGNISPEWGIDPYEWWQIDTVAVSTGTLFVIGGDKAVIHSFACPSKRTNKVHRYDYCQNRWIPVAPMLVARSHAAAIPFGHWIFVSGGSEDKERGASAEVYDFRENSWNFIANMNSSMRMCVGMKHGDKLYVKGENTGATGLVEGEVYDVLSNTWSSMSPGMRRGLARGPIASANSTLFVADWKDLQLKMYDSEQDSWKIVTNLPARISRLVGYNKTLFGLTGKIKVNPYNHHVISDSPAEVWRLALGAGACVVNWERQQDRTGEKDTLLRGIMGSALDHQERLNLAERHVGSEIEDDDGGYVWECLWRDPMQMAKTGGLAWVPCIAQCTFFED